MELDKRIKSINDIQSVLNSTKDSVGKVGYLAKSIKNFKNLSKCKYGTVDMYREDDECFCHEMRFTNGATDNTWYSYFIPEDKLESKEKKYRPYTLEEFSYIFKVGDLVEFRYKDSDEVKCAMFTGYITDVERIDDKTPGAVELMLGIFHYSLFSLFEDFELFYHGKWQPFGVLEE